MVRLFLAITLCLTGFLTADESSRVGTETSKPTKTHGTLPTAAVKGYSIKKVNHEYVDAKGNTHEDIADFLAKARYQKKLDYGTDATGIRFYIHWSAPSTVMSDLTVELKVRGLDAKTERETVQTFTKTYSKVPGFSGWATLDINESAYKRMGRLRAWKVSILQDHETMASRQSFTWDDSILTAEKTNP